MLKTKRIIALTIALLMILTLSLTGCDTKEPEKKEEVLPREIYTEKFSNYSFKELYFKNAETDRRVYGAEMIPDGLQEGEKIPCIIWVHGGSGDIRTLTREAEVFMADKVAGFLFECCGTSNKPMSDGREFNGRIHYTSRVSDLMAAYEYVKTLDYVDTSKIYLYGRSAGGLTIMLGVTFIKDEIPGIIVESSGLKGTPNSMLSVSENSLGVVEKYICPDDGWEDYINQYEGDVLFLCTETDETGAFANGLYNHEVYLRRENGTSEFIACPEGLHTWNSFTDEGQKMSIDAMRKFLRVA
ncbi:MAG: prolyl oligopeptidase family serine peptidase [Clostridia bacterium]|nr:prolyl oligopeptidase family serine peptidase [Clostridia bacterium]